ncbi:912_t:CDS:2 [Dentiscutata heterogama]|uniref:912_t:CDS:1 n=1 Tax=Dentiscutata heterogama TaxID=1316150 RepID=A0ACA9KXM4_9GLOM|nr:912_t:CDS:2 [Dentiscutata heterogama]
MGGDVVVGGHWLVEEKIGEGSFGEVFRAVHTTTNERYAIKREVIDIVHPQLPHEAEVLKLLKGASFIPKVYWFGTEGIYNAMIIDLFGPNLRLLRKAYAKLPVHFVSDVAQQMVTILEYIHKQGVVYRDVKPDNFLLERNFPLQISRLAAFDSDDDASETKIKDLKLLVSRKHHINIVDFGLSAFYIDHETGKHIQKNQQLTKNKTGTARYASLGVHRGLQHSRRDDMESLGYVLLELLRGDLPWAGVTARNSRQGWAKMLKIKEEIPLDELYEGFPRGFMLYLQYARNLQYDEEPDYNRLRKFLADTVGSGMEAEKVTREPLFFDEICERPLSPRQRSIRSQSPLTIKSPRGGNDYDDEIPYVSPPPSPFYKRKNFSWRTKNKDDMTCFGAPERANSLTISPNTNVTQPYQKFGTVSPRSFSLPYRDPGYTDNSYHPNGRDERRGKRPENIRKSSYSRRPSMKTTWNIVKDSNAQWEQEVQKYENAWKNGQSWNDNNFDSQDMNSVPSTPINEYGFWIDNADQEFSGFDGGLVGDSDGWINHVNDENIYMTEKLSKHRTQVIRNGADGNQNNQDYFDLERTRANSIKGTRDLRDIQSRRPSIPSPLSIAIPSNNIQSQDVASPNKKFDIPQYEDETDENVPLGPRRSIPNIRPNSLASKFLKRSVPNLRDAAGSGHTVPPPSSTIKRTIAHMQDTQLATTQGTRKPIPTGGNNARYGYVTKESPTNTNHSSRDDKDINTTTSQNYRYSPQDARYSPQDTRFPSGRDGIRNRERANTFSYNNKDSRLLPIPQTISPRQGNRAFNRERSYTFTSGNSPVSPNTPYPFDTPSPPHYHTNGRRERSYTFTDGGRYRDNNFNTGKNVYDRHRPPTFGRNFGQQNFGSGRNGNNNTSRSQINNHSPVEQKDSLSPGKIQGENFPPRAKSASPSYFHRRTNSNESESVDSKKTGQSLNITANSSSTESSTSPSPISPSPDSSPCTDDGKNRSIVSSPTSSNHVTFSGNMKESAPQKRPINIYRRQSFSALTGEGKSQRTRSLTFDDKPNSNFQGHSILDGKKKKYGKSELYI